jgi:hypothetical protein
MLYTEWPAIALSCPICGLGGCAIYRGYYSRFLFCTELEFIGRLVIRTGFCKSTKVRFGFIPEFVIRRRRISRYSVERLREARRLGPTMLHAIDALVADLDEEFFLPLSTAHSYLQSRLDRPP